MNEDALVAAIAQRLRTGRAARVLLGIGDDAAVWQPSRSARSVVTTDALVEGIHFTQGALSPEEIGHRALAANLSDLAAMGARPVLATVALGFPADTPPELLLRCYDGIAALAERARCAIAGGDLTRAPALTFAVTAIGEVRPSNLKLRSGARPGDVVAVTGPLGASRAGLELALDAERAAQRDGAVREEAGDGDAREALRAFRLPEPRLREGFRLGGSRSVHALMDLSDGLSTDLGRMCEASGCGAEIDGVPVSAAARAIAERRGADAEAWALHGGEDYELLAAIDRRAFPYLARRFAAQHRRPLLQVGRITVDRGVRLRGERLAALGWDHLRC
ncbi:MAG: thiamine-phosphate kinase [Candidatus Eremiobacteraeota bacterium]|nr:thiamine-phosphate kinase [Candidatus Eremiobacteraeota bacterium]